MHPALLAPTCQRRHVHRQRDGRLAAPAKSASAGLSLFILLMGDLAMIVVYKCRCHKNHTKLVEYCIFLSRYFQVFVAFHLQNDAETNLLLPKSDRLLVHPSTHSDAPNSTTNRMVRKHHTLYGLRFIAFATSLSP